MPEPGKFKDKKSFIAACISASIDEGYKPKQAAGRCYGIWDNYIKKHENKNKDKK